MASRILIECSIVERINRFVVKVRHDGDYYRAYLRERRHIKELTNHLKEGGRAIILFIACFAQGKGV